MVDIRARSEQFCFPRLDLGLGFFVRPGLGCELLLYVLAYGNSVQYAIALRSEKLVGWSTAPSARLCHPQEDHLIPLVVAVGAAEEELGTRTYHEETLFGVFTASAYRFGTTE